MQSPVRTTGWEKDGRTESRNFEGQTLTQATCPDFSRAVFTNGAYFKETVFDCPVDFSKAVFLGGDVDFTGAVFLGGVSFENARFGHPYQRDFGEWEILFRPDREIPNYQLLRRKKGEGPDRSFERYFFAGDSFGESFLRSLGFKDSLEQWEKSFQTFRNNPGHVLFKDCRFGGLDLGKFDAEEFESAAAKEQERIQKIIDEPGPKPAPNDLEFFKKNVLSPNSSLEKLSEAERTLIISLLVKNLDREKILNSLVRLEDGADVDFTGAQFWNQSKVDFSRSLFLNPETVSFDDSSWSNGGDVWFLQAKWSNVGDVGFDSAVWSNVGDVGFDSAVWSNVGAVRFGFAKWSNGGHVGFRSAVWSNGGDVGFGSTSFNNKGGIGLAHLILANGGKGAFSKIRFREEAEVRFDECLFIPKEKLSFRGARFPEKGSTMFQRCFFGRTPEVDFTGAYFRHTSFEGGDVGWLKEDPKFTFQQNRLQEILKKLSRLGNLPGWLEKYRNMAVPSEGAGQALPPGGSGSEPQSGPDQEGRQDSSPPSRLRMTFNRIFCRFSKNLSHRNSGDSSQPQKPTPVFDPETRVLWKDLTPESARHLTFRLVNLSRSIFDGMTLSRIQLNAPGWDNSKDRGALYEEVQMSLAMPLYEKLRDIEDQYTQLKNNLERQGNYLHAGDFHYGEQEIRRKILEHKGLKNPDNLIPWILSTVYKAVSGYGERPWRAIMVSICSLFILTGMLTWAGTDFSQLNHLPPQEWFFKGGVKAFKSFLILITPFSWKQEITGIAPSNFWFYFCLVSGQIFFLAIQVPLLVMAVRRRFKR